MWLHDLDCVFGRLATSLHTSYDSYGREERRERFRVQKCHLVFGVMTESVEPGWGPENILRRLFLGDRLAEYVGPSIATRGAKNSSSKTPT